MSIGLGSSRNEIRLGDIGNVVLGRTSLPKMDEPRIRVFQHEPADVLSLRDGDGR